MNSLTRLAAPSSSIILLASLAFVSTIPSAARAAWPPDSSMGVPLCSGFWVDHLQIVSDGNNGAIVAWRDYRDGGSDHRWDLYAQHVLADGAVDPAWPLNGVAVCTERYDQTELAMVPDAAGGAIIAWKDNRTFGSWDIYAQHVLPTGNIDSAWPAGGLLVCGAPWEQLNPQMISDGAGGALLTWQDERSGGGNADIYAHHAIATGVVDPTWPANGRAICTASDEQFSPLIVSDGSGGAVIVWTDRRNVTHWDLYAHRVLADGTLAPSWPANGLVVSDAPRDQAWFRAIADDAGGVIVGWADERGLPAIGRNIFANRVRMTGSLDPTWPPQGLLVSGVPWQDISTMVSDGAGGAIVVWVDVRAGWGQTDIYAHHVRSGGSLDPAWPTDGRALCTAPLDQSFIDAIPDGGGGTLLTWMDHRAGIDWDVYAHRVMADGAIDPAWPGNGRAVNSSDRDQVWSRFTSDGCGGAIVAWSQMEAPSGIYAQRIRPHGQVGEEVLAAPDDMADGVALESVQPNPTVRGPLSVAFRLRDAMPATLELFDVAGRRLESRDVGSLGPGLHQVSLDPRAGIGPGLYLIRLRQGSAARVRRVVMLD